ncbi:MAG: type II CRISPR-associated endonuclease Cas1 [Bacteroidetes bacterium]|nr:type II CRISPR-associated endonuclease Cas1 [Bacteroidota bacterium]
MLKRTLFFSNPFHLNIRLAQLEITDKKSGEIKTAPIEDLGFVVLDNREITITQSVFSMLAENNVAVIICDEKHHPASMMFHLDTNIVQNEKFRAQISASEPMKKQLWQQTVKTKIRNQAALLKHIGKDDPEKEGAGEALMRIATQVKSGDTTNEEAQAARKYWNKLFGENFTREREGMPPNPSLNYGYAILRAAVARALCGSGLLPTLGIHHHSKYNHYCLADDIMEPYRPFVDKVVWKQKHNSDDYHNLNKERKSELLSVLSCDVKMNGENSPLLVALSHTTASLVKCFEGNEKQLAYPTLG